MVEDDPEGYVYGVVVATSEDAPVDGPKVGYQVAIKIGAPVEAVRAGGDYYYTINSEDIAVSVYVAS